MLGGDIPEVTVMYLDKFVAEGYYMGNENDDKNEILKDTQKLMKLKLQSTILTTLICIGPYGNLILGIVNKDYSSLLVSALLTFPTLIIMSFLWCSYLNSIKEYKRLVKELNDEFKKD